MVDPATLTELDTIASLPLSDYATKNRYLQSHFQRLLEWPDSYRLEAPPHPGQLTGTATQAAAEFLKVLAERPALAHVVQSVIRKVTVHCTPAGPRRPIAIDGDELHFFQNDVNWAESAESSALAVLGEALYDQMPRSYICEYELHCPPVTKPRSDFAELFAAITGRDLHRIRNLAAHNADVSLARRIELIQRALTPEINFAQLDAATFENLVVDLLLSLGYADIVRQWQDQRVRREVDIKAAFRLTDPFGAPFEETWIVEIKFYRNERPDVDGLRQLARYLAACPVSFRGLLVTNSQLTSAAQSWLSLEQSRSRVVIRVIDGTELRSLILSSSQLLNKYFPRLKHDD